MAQAAATKQQVQGHGAESVTRAVRPEGAQGIPARLDGMPEEGEPWAQGAWMKTVASGSKRQGGETSPARR